MPTANVNLQALMQQPRRGQLLIPLLAHPHELLLANAVPQVAVIQPVLGDSGPGLRLAAVFGVVVADPDADMVGQGEEHAAGVVELFGGAAGEVAAGGAQGLRVEEGVAAEDVVCQAGGIWG